MVLTSCGRIGGYCQGILNLAIAHGRGMDSEQSREWLLESSLFSEHQRQVLEKGQTFVRVMFLHGCGTYQHTFGISVAVLLKAVEETRGNFNVITLNHNCWINSFISQMVKQWFKIKWLLVIQNN